MTFNSKVGLTTIVSKMLECFHMTSRRPYWCPKTMKRRPCWCPKPILWELNSFLIQTLSFVPINLHRSWPREWKRSIDTTFLLDKLDLVVHPEKSTSIPSQVLVILGFTIYSLTNYNNSTYNREAFGLQNCLCWVFGSYHLIYKGSSKCDWRDSG